MWSKTDLAANRLTSAIELYAEGGGLTSRFALNLPEYTQAQQRWQEAGCDWEVFEEVSPFGSEERRLLHAGRGLCVTEGSGTRMVGTVVIHAMLDYGSLPFITSQNPYVELFQSRPSFDAESTLGRDVGFVVYGWSLTPIYASSPTTWTIDAETFRRVYASRTPFWTSQDAGGRRDHVYLANDRGGIYAMGYPATSAVGHLVALAELVTLAGAIFVLLMLLRSAGIAAAGIRGERGRDLLHEIRASFYRKLFLAFVAVAVIPVLTLAFVARVYMMDRLRADVEEAAIRTTTVAQRFVEDSTRIQARGEGAAITINDDAIVGISRVIDQDVNVYDGPRLVATSERDLFASGLLPTRTAAAVYRAIVLDRRATYVGEERFGQFPYMVAAAPLKIAGLNGLITVPLTLRQRAIDREVDDLNRRILLGVLAFILIGSALGYWMAERIADPVNRLQRATARLARGDLDARVAVTSSDELRRLVEAFNSMAAELQRQQGALERTHRLEAWADMARQVAHEIKNPLTPVQLSAEHLRRVHADRGKPLSPVLEECVDSILGQVRLLRQIAGEFSSFASSPTARPVVTEPGRAGGRSGRALPRGPARRRGPLRRRSAGPARLQCRSQPAGPGPDQHDRERAACHAARRRPRDQRPAVAGRARDPSGNPRQRRGDGSRRPRPHLRAVLLDEGRRHGPRPHHRQAERGTARRRHHRGERPWARHDGARGNPEGRTRPAARVSLRVAASRAAGTASRPPRTGPRACRGTRARAARCSGAAG